MRMLYVANGSHFLSMIFVLGAIIHEHITDQLFNVPFGYVLYRIEVWKFNIKSLLLDCYAFAFLGTESVMMQLSIWMRVFQKKKQI